MVCGNPTGSAEHIFPAALGGRRTNRGIYCGDHNNGYSALAERLTEQLEYFNARLGIVNTRTKKLRSARITEIATGKTFRVTDRAISFEGPEAVEPGEQTLSFSSRREAEAWAKGQRAKGVGVRFVRQSKPMAYFTGTSQVEFTLGGAEGLRAIGYLGQTFLAHAFPAIAREDGTKPFVQETLQGADTQSVWWDFDPRPYSEASPFPFGHRIIVGVDAQSRVAFGYVSLFSVLDYAMIFGPVDSAASETRVFDIDPLARAEPADLVQSVLPSPLPAPRRPADQAEALEREKASGGAVARVEALMLRIEGRERALAAGDLWRRIAPFRDLTAPARAEAFRQLMHGERQRVFAMLSTMLRDFVESDAGRTMKRIGFDPALLIARDDDADDGLTAIARQAVNNASAAMAKRMAEEFEAGTLDEARVLVLIAHGEGHAIVLQAALEEILATLGG